MIRVFIADDQDMVREGFGALLSAEPDIEVVGSAGNGRAAIDGVTNLVAQGCEPNVVLMDIRMPQVDGLEATRKLLADRPTAAGSDALRVIILTTFDLDDYVYAALRAGASGFLLKDAPASELIGAVRVVAAGEALLAPAITRRLIADFVRSDRSTPVRPRQLDTLTTRETEVLVLVARGLSNSEIAGELVLSEQTVKTHVGHILTKLDLRDRTQAVVLAYESGLIQPAV